MWMHAYRYYEWTIANNVHLDMTKWVAIIENAHLQVQKAIELSEQN